MGRPGALLQRGLANAQASKASRIAVVGVASATRVATGRAKTPATVGRLETRPGSVSEMTATAGRRGVPGAMTAALPVREGAATGRRPLQAAGAAAQG